MRKICIIMLSLPLLPSCTALPQTYRSPIPVYVDITNDKPTVTKLTIINNSISNH